jgi:hypothetical protein
MHWRIVQVRLGEMLFEIKATSELAVTRLTKPDMLLMCLIHMIKPFFRGTISCIGRVAMFVDADIWRQIS